MSWLVYAICWRKLQSTWIWIYKFDDSQETKCGKKDLLSFLPFLMHHTTVHLYGHGIGCPRNTGTAEASWDYACTCTCMCVWPRKWILEKEMAAIPLAGLSRGGDVEGASSSLLLLLMMMMIMMMMMEMRMLHPPESRLALLFLVDPWSKSSSSSSSSLPLLQNQAITTITVMQTRS